MAILPGERTANVKESLFRYIEANYTLTSLVFQGQDVLDTTSLTEWIEVVLASRTSDFVRQVTSGNAGEIARYVLSTVLYKKPSDNIFRIDLMRDTIVNLLRRAFIPVYNYAGNAEQIGSIRSDGVIAEGPAFFENDLNIVPVRFGFSWVEEYTV